MEVSLDHNYCETIQSKVEYTCPSCLKVFACDSTLRRHQVKVHGYPSYEFPIRCLEKNCSFTFKSGKQLQEHLRNCHSFQFDTKTLVFASLNDFKAWKKHYESSSNVHFIKKNGDKHLKTYYTCNKSGSYISVSKGIRKHKTCRSGYYCTAGIILVQHDQLFKAHVCFTHYGHDVEPVTNETPEVVVSNRILSPSDKTLPIEKRVDKIINRLYKITSKIKSNEFSSDILTVLEFDTAHMESVL